MAHEGLKQTKTGKPSQSETPLNFFIQLAQTYVKALIYYDLIDSTVID